jgi:hypothetical protein
MSRRTGNSRKQAVWNKSENSLNEHGKYKLISDSSVFPLSFAALSSSLKREPFGDISELHLKPDFKHSTIEAENVISATVWAQKKQETVL